MCPSEGGQVSPKTEKGVLQANGSCAQLGILQTGVPYLLKLNCPQCTGQIICMISMMA